MASSGRPDIGISVISYAPIRQIRQISPLPGLFPKRHPVVLLLSEKIQKNIITTPLIISFLSPKRYTVFKKIEKFLFPYLPYHRLGVVFVPFSPQKQAAKKRVTLPLYRGYFQNLPQLRCCFPKKSEKNITSTPLTIKIPPLFCYTLFQLFFKNFCLSTADYHFFASKRSHLFKKFFKKTPHC